MRTVRLTVQVFGLLLAVYSWGFHSTTGMAQPPVAGEISPQQYEVVSELNQKAPMRDGVTLTVDIFRPTKRATPREVNCLRPVVMS